MSNVFSRILLSTLALYGSFSSPLSAQHPDSVWIRVECHQGNEGRGGMSFSCSQDSNLWRRIADGFVFLRCTHGRPPQKRMLNPMIAWDANNNLWHALWSLSPDSSALAHSTSNNLSEWKRQTYNYRDSILDTKAKGLHFNKVWRVPYTTVENMEAWVAARRYRERGLGESMSNENDRYPNLTEVKAELFVNAEQTKSISNNLIGIFFEDINYSADGGLYAELIQNRDFEYLPSERPGDTQWNAMTAWNISNLTAIIDSIAPIHPNTPHYLTIQGTGYAENCGFDGIVLKQGEKYNFSIFAKDGAIKISLIDKEKTLASTTLKPGKEWKQLTATLKPTSSSISARLRIEPMSKDATSIDFVSLMPSDTYKGRKNGLRRDLAEILENMHPHFVRFPGGCLAHGDGLDNIYRWKNTIGPIWQRKPMRNIASYHQSMGLGFHEYFQMCEDFGATPVPVVAAGVCCQNSGTASHYGTDDLHIGGQQMGIPMDEMEEYVQDILDLIEYANGDAKTTVWGKKRAENGHPRPFNLKYLGVGNEDLITDIFEERFKMIMDAVNAKYPDITVIGTTGWTYRDTDYNEGWEMARRLNIPMVDEHYYNPVGWFVNNQDFYDDYDRKGPKVYLGEYAAKANGRGAIMETALTEALYLTAIERNADVVQMTSYAPLLAKDGHTTWNPDLIYYNNTEVRPSPGYAVQKMFAENSGDTYIATELKVETRNESIRKRITASLVYDSNTNDFILKLVNLLPVETTIELNMPFIQGEHSTCERQILCGEPTDVTYTIEKDNIRLSPSQTYRLPKRSLTVLRIRGGKNNILQPTSNKQK